MEAYVNFDKFRAGGDEFRYDVDRLILYITARIWYRSKVAAKSVFNQIWQDNEDSEKAEEKYFLPNAHYEVLNEFKAKTRLEFVNIFHSHRKLIKPNLGFFEALWNWRDSEKIFANMLRSMYPVCRVMMVMTKMAVEAYELRLRNGKVAAPLHQSPLYNLSKTRSSSPIRGKQLREIAASIDELQTAVIIKYFTFEMNVRERSMWWDVYQSATDQMKLVVDRLKPVERIQELMQPFNAFKGDLERARNSYKEMTNSGS